MRKSAIVWRSFHNHQSITSAHSSIFFFGAADPGDETYDRLSWDEVKLTADLVLYEGFDEEQFVISRLSPQVNALITRLSEGNTSKAKVSSSTPSGSDYLSVDSAL